MMRTCVRLAGCGVAMVLLPAAEAAEPEQQADEIVVTAAREARPLLETFGNTMRVPGERIELLRGTVAGHGSQAEGGRQEGAGFIFVNFSQLIKVERDVLTLTFHVEDLSLHQPEASRGVGQLTHELGGRVARGSVHVRQQLEGERLKRIASEDGHVLAVNLVTGRHAASEIVVIHAREVVVNKRVSVQAFHSTGSRQGGGDVSSTGFSSRESENGPQAFSSCEHAVPHGFVESRR